MSTRLPTPGCPRPVRGRLRRILVGLAVCAATLLVLGFALEIAARLWFAREFHSFRPVYRADEVAGYRFAPNLSEYAFGARVETNSLGWRGPEWSASKPEGVFRIALIGDSLAFGFGVDWPDTMGEVLAGLIGERTGVAAEVLNFGVPGYNSRQELAVLEREALAFGPDLAIVLMTSNDHQSRLRVDGEGWLHWGDPGSDRTRVESEHLPRSERWGLLRHSALLTYLKYVWVRYRSGRSAPAGPESSAWMAEVEPGPIAPRIEETVLEPLLRMARLCEERGVPLVLLAFASGVHHRRAILEFEKRTGSPTLELLGLFPDVSSNPEWIEKYGLGWDPHPGADAHARFAEATVELLADSGLLPDR